MGCCCKEQEMQKGHVAIAGRSGHGPSKSHSKCLEAIAVATGQVLSTLITQAMSYWSRNVAFMKTLPPMIGTAKCWPCLRNCFPKDLLFACISNMQHPICLSLLWLTRYLHNLILLSAGVLSIKSSRQGRGTMMALSKEEQTKAEKKQ